MINWNKVGLGLLLIVWVGFSQLSMAQVISKESKSFRQAQELYDKGLYSASRLSFEKHISEYPDNSTTSEATYFKAISAIRTSQKDGESLIQAYIDRYPDGTHSSTAYLELAEYFYDQKKEKKAIAYFEKSGAVISKLSNQVKFIIGHAYFLENEYMPAKELFSTIEGDKKADASYFLGFILYWNKEEDEALENLEIALESEEYGKEALKLYSLILYKNERYEEAIELVDSKAVGTTDPVLLKTLGDSHYELGQYRLAAMNYKEFLKRNKRTDAGSFYKIGTSFYKIEEKDAAIENLKKAALSKDEIGAHASYLLGNIYVEEDNLIFASTAFKNASEYPIALQEEALFAYGKTEFDLQKFHSVIEIFTQYRNDFPSGKNIGQANELLTTAYFNNENYPAAIAYIESLSYLSPQIKADYQRITFLEASNNFNRKKFARSIILFKKSLKYPEDKGLAADANYWIGEAFSFEKKYSDAIPHYHKGANQGSYLSRYGLGYATYNQKEYDRAATHFSNFISNYSGQVNTSYLTDALVRLGDSYYVLKEYDQAVASYQQAEEKGSKNLEYIYYQVGLVSRYKGDNEQANANFEKLRKAYPQSEKADDALFQTAQISYESGNYESASRKFQQYIREYPNTNFAPFVLLNQAVSFYNLGNYEGAANNYKIILERFERHETANSALLGLQELAGMGEFDEFSDYLAKYKKANPDSDALEHIEFETAKALYYNLQYEKSIQGFQNFITNYPNSSLATDAKYFTAEGYYRQGNMETALDGYYAVASNTDYPRYNKVIYRIADIESKLGDENTSNEYYRLLKISANTFKEKVNALSGLMQNHFRLEAYDSAFYYGTELINSHRISNDMNAEASLTIGVSLYHLGEMDEAFDWLLVLVSNAPDVRGAQAKYYISKIFYDKEDYNQSLKSLFELTDTYVAHEYWVGMAFLLMSDNYLATDELFQAEATLNSLIENSSLQEIRQEAQAKLKVIRAAEAEEVVELDSLEVHENDGQ